MRKCVDILIISTSFSPTKSYCQSSARFSQVLGTLTTCLYIIYCMNIVSCVEKTGGSFPIRHCEARRFEGGENVNKLNVKILKHIKTLNFIVGSLFGAVNVSKNYVECP